MDDISYMNIVDNFQEISTDEQFKLSGMVDGILSNENFMYFLEEFNFSQHVANSDSIEPLLTDELEHLLRNAIKDYGSKDLKDIFFRADEDFIKVLIFSFELKLRLLNDFMNYLTNNKKEGA